MEYVKIREVPTKSAKHDEAWQKIKNAPEEGAAKFKKYVKYPTFSTAIRNRAKKEGLCVVTKESAEAFYAYLKR